MRAFGFLGLANSGSFVHRQAPYLFGTVRALTEPNVMLGIRYHVVSVGGSRHFGICGETAWPIKQGLLLVEVGRKPSLTDAESGAGVALMPIGKWRTKLSMARCILPLSVLPCEQKLIKPFGVLKP